MSKFNQAGPGMWDIKWQGSNIATFSLPDIKLEKIDHIPYKGEIEVHWGHAICDDNPDFTYIYGAGNAKPYVARAPKGNILGQWEFYTGADWVLDPDLAKPMLDIIGSEQFSVFKLNDKYVYITQEGGFSKNIYSYISSYILFYIFLDVFLHNLLW